MKPCPIPGCSRQTRSLLCPEHWQLVPAELQQQLRRNWRLLNDRQRPDRAEWARQYCSAWERALLQVRAIATDYPALAPQPLAAIGPSSG
jgi:hypothetical protein